MDLHVLWLLIERPNGRMKSEKKEWATNALANLWAAMINDHYSGQLESCFLLEQWQLSGASWSVEEKITWWCAEVVIPFQCEHFKEDSNESNHSFGWREKKNSIQISNEWIIIGGVWPINHSFIANEMRR